MTLCAVAVGLSAAVGAAKTAPDLTVHEWGTFLVMQGADGVTLDGMYHEEHALPSFVHARGKDQLRIPAVMMKGETPVIYFYTDQAQRVNVEVGFPKGIWTQWYPQASRIQPSLASTAAPELRDGKIAWDVDLLPAGDAPAAGRLPRTATDALWDFARDVDAAYVRARPRQGPEEYERFIFYRGLGEAPLPLTMTPDQGGTLKVADSLGDDVRDVFILRVENGKGAYRYVPRVRAGEQLERLIPAPGALRPMKEFTPRIADDLAARLTEAGLYPKEARAMVNTWSTSYFRNDGVRALFVMPQSWTDRFIPMRVEPQPKSIVRVMVGRLELLTGERERLAEAAVRDLAATDSASRDRAFEFLREQGRYVEPIVRRVQRTTRDPQVRVLCNRLLLTGFVTDLRTAVKSAANGAPISEKPVHMRAALASLLREIGLEKEAKETARAALAELRTEPAPAMNRSSSRHYYRAQARAVEGTGDDAAAAKAYAQFVRFGAHVKQCGGCHQSQGPATMAWYKDWWAGRKFAQYARQDRGLSAWITEQERALAANRADTGTQMLLAYLYEARGDRQLAAGMWAEVAPPSRVARTGAVTR
jgi:hypothetical protein